MAGHAEQPHSVTHQFKVVPWQMMPSPPVSDKSSARAAAMPSDAASGVGIGGWRTATRLARN